MNACLFCVGELPTLSRLPPERNIQTGIPEEAFDLECPDLELKASVLQEFILLDQKYVEKLGELEQQHKQATELVCLHCCHCFG